jgi:hypothetical protein
MGSKFFSVNDLKVTRDGCLATPARRPKPYRRRPTQQQGQALEILGHAIEYLIDSRPFLPAEMGGADYKEALEILKLRSLMIFAECAAVVSSIERFKYWLGGVLNC